MSDTEPQSPCVAICVLNDDDICEGCYRSADEITDWFMATPQEKRDIIRRAAERRDASSDVRLL
ncbi:MAG: DUF1289 domain-containing protein [Pseudomonadota bacterium]